jgi:hypothetical protein
LHNAVVAWNTLHIGPIVGQLRAEGQVIDDEILGLTTPLIIRKDRPVFFLVRRFQICNSWIMSPVDSPLSRPVNLPLSGAVTQTFAPWIELTVNVGQSSNPAMEKDALSVASYGKQLGRIGDVLIVLLKHIDLSGLSADEEDAIIDLKCMLHEIAKKKEAQGAKHILWPDLK